MKILFINNIPSKYRTSFFDKLGLLCDLTVIFEQKNLKYRDKSFVDNKSPNFKSIYLNAKSVGKDNSISFKIKKYLKSNKYDLVILGNYHTFTDVIATNYMIHHKVKYGLSIDGMFINKKESKIKYKLKNKMFKNSSFFLTTGCASIEAIKYYGGNPNKCYLFPFSSIADGNILPSIVDTNSKIELRKKHKINTSSKIYLYVGQMIKRKGIDLLLSIFPNDNRFTLLLIGGKLPKNYIKIINDRKLNNVINYDFIPFESLSDYYKLADYFILPTNEDAWALVINEALSYSLPVISTDRALGALELIKNKNTGFVVKNNKKELLNAIMTSFETKDDSYIQMQMNALKIAKLYTIEQMVDAHLKIFREIISNENL